MCVSRHIHFMQPRLFNKSLYIGHAKFAHHGRNWIRPTLFFYEYYAILLNQWVSLPHATNPLSMTLVIVHENKYIQFVLLIVQHVGHFIADA